MKRVNSTDIPAALHSAKVIALVALHLARTTNGGEEAPELVSSALRVLGYDRSPNMVQLTTDPTIARALVLVTKGLQS